MRCELSPVGDMVAGMAYLVRRLLENTSNESFLHSWREGTDSRSCSPLREPAALRRRADPRAAASTLRDSLLEALADWTLLAAARACADRVL